MQLNKAHMHTHTIYFWKFIFEIAVDTDDFTPKKHQTVVGCNQNISAFGA